MTVFCAFFSRYARKRNNFQFLVYFFIDWMRFKNYVNSEHVKRSKRFYFSFQLDFAFFLFYFCFVHQLKMKIKINKKKKTDITVNICIWNRIRDRFDNFSENLVKKKNKQNKHEKFSSSIQLVMPTVDNKRFQFTSDHIFLFHLNSLKIKKNCFVYFDSSE